MLNFYFQFYFLKTKEAEEVFNKLEIFFDNFGYLSILLADNGGKFDNNILNNYFKDFIPINHLTFDIINNKLIIIGGKERNMVEK